MPIRDMIAVGKYCVGVVKGQDGNTGGLWWINGSGKKEVPVNRIPALPRPLLDQPNKQALIVHSETKGIRAIQQATPNGSCSIGAIETAVGRGE